MNTAMNQIRNDLGLPPTSDIAFEYPLRSALYLQLGAEGFEYPRSDLPSIVRYVGPPTPLPDPDWQQPAWWPELQSGKTVVLVNQGTVATDSNELLRPSLDALASDDDLLVVAVTGGPDPDVLEPLPANARLERFIPFDQVLPHVDLFVTNGGFAASNWR
jgi:UDP:flavonoid glycosyltransferase YjiC (YdhE family)